MNLVSVVIKEKYGNKIREACREAGKDPKQYYRWCEMGALIDAAGNVYRYVDGATIDSDGESVQGKVYVLIGKFYKVDKS